MSTMVVDITLVMVASLLGQNLSAECARQRLPAIAAQCAFLGGSVDMLAGNIPDLL